MNRVIKFRVWIVDKKKMIYEKPFISQTKVISDDLLIRLDGIVCHVPSASVIDRISNEYVLMQYTGLKDSQGTEIYEGDIIKKSSEIGEVKYDEDRFIIFGQSGYWYSREGREFSWKEIEVIGNIHQNPELLKGNK